MSCAIAIRATKTRAPRSTSLVDDLGGGNRRTGGGGVSLRPGRARREGSRLVPHLFDVAPTDAHVTHTILASTSLGPSSADLADGDARFTMDATTIMERCGAFGRSTGSSPPLCPIRLL